MDIQDIAAFVTVVLFAERMWRTIKKPMMKCALFVTTALIAILQFVRQWLHKRIYGENDTNNMVWRAAVSEIHTCKLKI